MKARDAALQLGVSPQDFGQRVLSWLEELGLKTTRVVVLQEYLSAEIFAKRIHVDKTTADRIFLAVQPRCELSRKCVRVPASALAAFMANKKLPPKKRVKR